MFQIARSLISHKLIETRKPRGAPRGPSTFFRRASPHRSIVCSAVQEVVKV